MTHAAPSTRGLNRRSALKLLIAGGSAGLVSGCGFQPLYGRRGRDNLDGQRVVGGLKTIQVATIPNRTGQILRRELQILMSGGRPDPRPRFELSVGLSETVVRQALLDDDSASFSRLDLVAPYRLVDRETGETVTSGESNGSSSFNVVQSQFANLNAVEGAREQAALLIAQDITRRLSLYFDGLTG